MPKATAPRKQRIKNELTRSSRTASVERKIMAEAVVPPKENLLHLQSMKQNKMFRCVSRLPNSVDASDPVVTVTSFVSSNGSIVSAYDRHILIDLGAIEERVHRGVFEMYSNQAMFCEKSSTEKWSLLNRNMVQENNHYKNNANIPPSHTTKIESEIAFVEKLINSLPKTEAGFLIFRCILITSRDTDNWNLLKYLMFYEGNLKKEQRQARENIQVECVVFHGVPEFLDTQPEYYNLIKAIVEDYPATEVYLGSFPNRLTVQNLDDLKEWVHHDSTPRMNFIGFSTAGVPVYNSSDGSISNLPYSGFLKITHPNNVNDIWAQAVLPIINPHHYQVNGHWKVQSRRSCYNEDVLMVGILVKDYSIFFPGDASINLQQQYIRLMKTLHLQNVKWDVIVAAHNSSLHNFSFLDDIFKISWPKAIILPNFYEKGYPNQNCIDTFINFPSLMTSAPHEIMYFKTVEPRVSADAPNINGRKPRQFYEFKCRTSKLLFTLQTPLTIRISSSGCLFAQDWSGTKIDQD